MPRMLAPNSSSSTKARRSLRTARRLSSNTETQKGSEVTEDSHAKQRLERKRATDRVAQREHRKRQKDYIEELEAQLQMVKGDGRDGLAQLMEENERLRKELNQMKSFFRNVKELVVETDSMAGSNQRSQSTMSRESNSPRDDSESRMFDTSTRPPMDTVVSESIDAVFQLQADQGGDSSAVAKFGSAPMYRSDVTQDSNITLTDLFAQVDVLDHDSNVNMMEPDQRSGSSQVPPSQNNPSTQLPQQETNQETWPSPQEFPQGLSSFYQSFVDIYDILSPQFSTSYHLGSEQPQTSNDWRQQHEPNNPTGWPLSGNYPSLDSSTIYRPVNTMAPREYHTNQSQFLTNEPLPPVIQSFSRMANRFPDSPPTTTTHGTEVHDTLAHRSLPNVLLPPLPQDTYAHEIIERARANTLFARVLVAAPTLTDFLFDNPSNVLSANLKIFLEPIRRSKQTPEFLATYWVVYLLLRWQITQTPSSFANVPAWFRPTKMQRDVQHPITIDFVAWPALRDALIQLSTSTEMTSAASGSQIHEIMEAVGTYLEVDLSACGAALQGGQDESLHNAICDLRNWKLHDGFYERWPKLRGLVESSVAQFYG